jgi:hypothetical protein
MYMLPINVSVYHRDVSPEERDFWGQIELEAAEPPLSEGEAFDVINGRTYVATWPDDDFPW